MIMISVKSSLPRLKFSLKAHSPARLSARARTQRPMKAPLSLTFRPHCSVAKGRFTNRRRCEVPPFPLSRLPFLRSHPFQPPHPATLLPFVPLDRSAAPGREFRDASLNCAAKKFAHRLGCQPLKPPRGERGGV